MAEDGPWDLPTFAAAHFTDWGAFSIPAVQRERQPSVPLGGEVWMVPEDQLRD